MSKIKFVFEIDAQALVAALANQAELTVSMGETAQTPVPRAKKSKKYASATPSKALLDKVSTALASGASGIGEISKAAKISKTSAHHALAHLISTHKAKRIAIGKYAHV